MHNLITLFKENQFLIAGLGLSGMGIITFWIRDIPLKIFKVLKRQLTTDLTINNYDIIFYKLLKLIKQENKHKNFRALKINNGRWGSEESLISMGYGNHFIKYKNKFIFVQYIKEKEGVSDRVKETITLTKIGRNKLLFEHLLKDLEELDKDNEKLSLFKMSDYWNFSKYIRKRKLKTIFLEKDKKELIFNTLKNFIEREQWYLDNGIPYQLGILLYGRPGTGKTSLIKAIASELNYNIYYLSPNKLYSIEQALTDCKEKSIIVIEDIDTEQIVQDRKTNNNKSEDIITDFMKGNLSDILNSIDGLSNTHGRILIGTTNHIQKLDKALIRPGRFDLLIKIDQLNKEILEQFFIYYFPKEKIDLNKININKNISVAELQNMILLNKSSQEILNFITKKRR